MKISEKTKHITCGVVIGAMLATSAPALASQATKMLNVTYNNIKIVVDGQQVSTNKNNEPFIYNGTTYLPIRAVGEAVGKQVSWDGRTNTVYLGASPVSSGEQYLVDVCPPYQGGFDIKNTVKMAGKTYIKALSLYSNSYAPNSVLINLDAKYRTLEFDLGAQDGYATDIVLNFYIDGVLVKRVTHAKDELPTHYSIPLNNALQLEIEVDSYYSAVMANCTVK